MTKVLFICHGNICRSPMAEYVLKHMVRKRGISEEFEIASAATSREEIGNDIHRGTKTKLTEIGIPYSDRKAAQVTKRDYEDYEYLLCMDSNNLRNLARIVGEDANQKIFRLLDFSSDPRDIADPWYTGNFDETYNDIMEGCEAFLSHLESAAAYNNIKDCK
ncbi:low molecular weight protein-tyrosine-phosphatase [Clostridium aminobutyricum]|uniref:protein-tyrosine-phosphatase n=1 Tax=Clostridium aminobutyricum TaxID=33953 RepID=A0A939DA18_CLOAM|nr:low molecular weight protein-tyrosine-phosphatase [Clostridium aminobutyricum]MBN7773478.1 low molecular weight phosphotyrosine protein phosphatase [Clostridium aminobutyricum]